MTADQTTKESELESYQDEISKAVSKRLGKEHFLLDFKKSDSVAEMIAAGISSDRLKWIRQLTIVLLALLAVTILSLIFTSWRTLSADHQIDTVALALLLSTQLIIFITAAWGIVALNRDRD